MSYGRKQLELKFKNFVVEESSEDERTKVFLHNEAITMRGVVCA